MNSNITTAAIITAIFSATVGALTLIDQHQPYGPVPPPPAIDQAQQPVTVQSVRSANAASDALRTARSAGLPECARTIAWIVEEQPSVTLNVPIWDEERGIPIGQSLFIPTTMPQLVTRYTATDEYNTLWTCDVLRKKEDGELIELRR